MTPISVGSTDSLIVVDLQVDFCPGGALAVPNGDEVIPLVNRLLTVPGWFKVGTRDWHPSNHLSFSDYGGTWPVHCVADSPGAGFHPNVNIEQFDLIVSKATRNDQEAYSGFDGTSLDSDLKGRNIRRVFVCGLATDYCVRATALDAHQAGFEVVVMEDAIRAVNLNPGDEERALQDMRDAGCIFASSKNISD